MSHSHVFSRSLLSLAVVSLTCLPVACHKTDARMSLAANSVVEHAGDPTIIAAYLPWFGRPGHIDVGYSSQDRVVLEKQIEQARRLGIAAFVVNWYGAKNDFENKAYALMQEVAAEKSFKVAVMYDEDDSDPATATDTVIADLQYAYEHYLGPHASANRDAYLRYQGRTMIFIFPKGTATDWNRVHQAVNAWEDPPLLIFKDIRPEQAADFDGFYAWVNPGKRGWQPDGSNWGEQYLDSFYKTMSTDYPNKIAVGAAWPGFDDSKASWGRNRKMDARCGRTFDDTLRLFRRYYDKEHQLPFIMVETWNDYEEGTAIEKGVNTCK